MVRENEDANGQQRATSDSLSVLLDNRMATEYLVNEIDSWMSRSGNSTAIFKDIGEDVKSYSYGDDNTAPFVYYSSGEVYISCYEMVKNLDAAQLYKLVLNLASPGYNQYKCTVAAERASRLNKMLQTHRHKIIYDDDCVPYIVLTARVQPPDLKRDRIDKGLRFNINVELTLRTIFVNPWNWLWAAKWWCLGGLLVWAGIRLWIDGYLDWLPSGTMGRVLNIGEMLLISVLAGWVSKHLPKSGWLESIFRTLGRNGDGNR